MGERLVSDLLSAFAREWHLFIPIGVIGILSWSIWLTRKLLSNRCRSVVNDFRTTTSVVVPSFREDPDVLERCLDTWLAQRPTEVIVVLDIGDREAERRLGERRDLRLSVIVFPHRGKRSALGVGIRAARGEVLVLCDSDTAWLPGLLSAVQMPFADPRVGAVSTRQNVYRPGWNVWRRVADWILDLRYLDYVPATGRVGAVVCVSGRTAAYRRSVVVPVLEHLEHEFFLGRRCNAGDDGRLTWLVLASGYRTVHQSSARALSMFPNTLRAFCKQRLRWSRNSYRCYLTAAWNGWLWQAPLVSQVTVLQILFTPVTMFAAVYYVVLAGAGPAGTHGLVLAGAWLLIGRMIRSLSHLRRKPGDIVLLPVVILVIALVALPIKVYALFTMNRQGWLTRRSALVGGEGQDEASLAPGVARPPGVAVSS
jgi:cellulose synthase/poly-beta-1,6-N-acetylglucosamine synthase-like glycosyltransferase